MAFRSTIPVGTDGEFVQALSLNEALAHQITISGTTARNSSGLAADTRVIEVYSDIDCFIRQGSSSVVATTSDHFFPAGFSKIFSLGGDKTTHKTHLAVISSGSAGTFYISEVH